MGNLNALVQNSNYLGKASCGNSVQQLQDILATRLPSLHRRASRLLGNTSEAEDAVQDALLSAYMHLEQFEGRAQLSTWLNAIVINSARMHLRMRRRYVPCVSRRTRCTRCGPFLFGPTGRSQTHARTGVRRCRTGLLLPPIRNSALPHIAQNLSPARDRRIVDP
jgi:hypothetical protein